VNELGVAFEEELKGWQWQRRSSSHFYPPHGTHPPWHFLPHLMRPKYHMDAGISIFF